MQVIDIEQMPWHNAARPFTCFYCKANDAEFKMTIQVSDICAVTCCVCCDCLPILSATPELILTLHQHRPAPCGEAGQGVI